MNDTNKKTPSDLTNTYIENDFGELRDLYVKALLEQSFLQTPNKVYENEHFILVTEPNTYIGWTDNEDFAKTHYRKVTLKDLKPKPKTKIEYIPCNLSPSEIYTNMICGEEYYINKCRMWFDGNQFWLQDSPDSKTSDRITYIEDNHEVCEKVERELKWFEDLGEGGVLCKNSDEGISLVIGYKEGSVTPFRTIDEDYWVSMIPLTKKEIQVFMDNAQE